MSVDSLLSKKRLTLGDDSYDYFDLTELDSVSGGNVERLPVSLKVLLENLLRFEDGNTVTTDDIVSLSKWQGTEGQQNEIAFRPSRVLMQDFTGVPAVADLAAMRNAVTGAGHDAALVNPQIPVDLVIDHSVMVDHFGSASAFQQNVSREMARNVERYRFLKWGQMAFDRFFRRTARNGYLPSGQSGILGQGSGHRTV